MATKSDKGTKTGGKRKASTSHDKIPKKSSTKKETSAPAKKTSGKKQGPESKRELWTNKDEEDSSDDGGAFDDEDEVDAPPAKKSRQALEHTDPSKQFQKEKSRFLTVQPRTCSENG